MGSTYLSLWNSIEDYNRYASDPSAPFRDGPFASGGTALSSGTNGGSSAQSQVDALKKYGLFSAVMGGISQAFGAYYAAKSAQYQMKSQASAYNFQADMAKFNASAAEADARSVMEAGKTEVARYTMQAGQAKASAKTAMGSRGIALGVGSARDVEASMDLVKDMDVLTINSNAVRAANARRMQGANYQTAAAMYGVSGQNAMLSANSISPFMSMGTSLLNSASMFAARWNRGQGGINSWMYGENY